MRLPLSPIIIFRQVLVLLSWSLINLRVNILHLLTLTNSLSPGREMSLLVRILISSSPGSPDIKIIIIIEYDLPKFTQSPGVDILTILSGINTLSLFHNLIHRFIPIFLNPKWSSVLNPNILIAPHSCVHIS